MVFVKDFRTEFYDVVQHQTFSCETLLWRFKDIVPKDLQMPDRLLVLVTLDVDAVCACRILQYLFRCDNILYTIVPVDGKQDLERAFAENAEGINHVLLLNCGGALDVVDLLQPEDHVVFFICDSHRPVDVHNIYNAVQVKLLMRQHEFDDVPEFEQVFRDEDESDLEGYNSDDSEPSGKRQRTTVEVLEKRRERRLWEERRHKIIFEYSEFTGYGTSIALLLYEMAWKMSKDTNDLLWLAIIGVTEQFINQKADRDKYIEDVGQLQSHVSRLNQKPADSEENPLSIDCLKVSFDSELSLTLYRHWSLLESLCHSEYTACKFRVWTMKGKKRLHEFLADMGLPLVQCRQKFTSMDINYRDSVKEVITKYMEKYNLSEQDLFLPSFQAHHGFRNKYCAKDMVHACESVLESIEKDSTSSGNFLQAVDVLTRSKVDVMEQSLETAKTQLKAVVSQVQSFLDINQIVCVGPFFFTFVQEGTADARFFSRPLCLSRLARFTLEAYCSVNKNKKARALPLVLGAPLNSDMGTMLVVGIPPLSETSQKNCLGKAFEQAAAATKAQLLQDRFDTNIVELKMEDKDRFFDSLVTLLQ